MKRCFPFRSSTLLLILVCFTALSCIDANAPRRSIASKSTGLTNGNKLPGTAVGAVSDGTDTSGSGLISQKVELSHLVDPFDGTYKKKLTLPKNFKGNLYLAGLNVAALQDKFIKVRFNFGMERQSITLNATLARAPGIVPKTDIQVLVIDMNASPFKNMRLPYDLYDYNDYSAASKEIVSDPRDGGLYCRGLRLEDDPTFIASSEESTCKAGTDKCLYSYAKIADATLYSKVLRQDTVNTYDYFTSIPSRAQAWTESGSTRSPTVSDMAGSVCLPDDNTISPLKLLFGLAADATFSYDMLIQGLYYRGPYRTFNEGDWQISDNAVYGYNTDEGRYYGLFQTKVAVNSTTNMRFNSMLFPIAGKLSLGQGKSYLGATTRIAGPKLGTRSIEIVTDPSGTTQYVDGCNIRVSTTDPSTGENISSCNVNASIEVFYMSENKETIITADKTIKLQLTRSSLTYQGKEVLATAFKRCDNSGMCGSDECCFNSRCWSKELVTQCVDETPTVGNLEIGDTCSSDFECSSLCCNESTGSCAPHNPNGTVQAFCSKPSGQQCVSKEFCKQEAVVTCKIVKSGFNADGTAACTLRCPAIMTYGDCKSGYCVPPVQPAVPAFDPADCSKAVDP